MHNVNPTVLIVDDTPQADAILYISQALTALDCNVVVKSLVDEAVEIAKTNIIDLVLMDVCLDRDYKGDRRGIALAERLTGSTAGETALAPEAAIVFISRPFIIGEDAQTVLHMFNRRIGLGFGRRRLAEAYEDKEQTERVVTHVKEILLERGFPLEGHRPTLNATVSSWEAICDQIQRKFSGSGLHPRLMPVEQVVRIIKGLFASAFGAISSVELNRVSKGRSRSLVLSVECNYRSGLSEYRIVKIGALATIDMEVKNYTERVPSLLPGGSYPRMAGYASSRDLAGISYAELSRGGGLPDSLGDRFWTLDTGSLERIFHELYHRTIVDSVGPRSPRFKPFVRLYADRFWNLRPNSELHERVRNSIRKCRFLSLRDEKIFVGHEISEGIDPLPHPTDVVLHLLAERIGAGYLEAVVHGDLHPDNVLMAAENHFHLIDFAHTAEHHASLDHIVMEAMMRSQMLRSVLETAIAKKRDRRSVVEATVTWLRIEAALVREDWSGAEELAGGGWWQAEFSRLLFAIKWIRGSALSRNFVEQARFYHSGLGLVAYSFIGLPDESGAKDAIRDVLVFLAALSFGRALSISSDRTPADTWGTLAELDSGLSASASAWEGWMLKTARGSIARVATVLLRAPSNSAEIAAPAHAAREELALQFPKLCAFVGRMAEEMRFAIDETKKDYNAIAVVIIIKAYFDKAIKIGLNSGVLKNAAQQLNQATRRLWEMC